MAASEIETVSFSRGLRQELYHADERVFNKIRKAFLIQDEKTFYVPGIRHVRVYNNLQLMLPRINGFRCDLKVAKYRIQKP